MQVNQNTILVIEKNTRIDTIVDMYKRMNLNDLVNVQTGFFDRMHELQTKEGHQSFLSFLKSIQAEANRTYFFHKNRPFVRIYSNDGVVRIVDETEKIDIELDDEGVQRLHNTLKNTGTMRGMSSNQSILEGLLDQYRDGNLRQIAGKSYLVYDIETTFGTGTGQYFEMSYDISSADDHSEEFKYTYVDRTNMKELADRLLAYDGWIIGYNNFSFDNPVLLKNCGYGEKEIEALNKKSLDPFILIQKLTGRRMSLNNLAGALIGAGKTLSSGAEGADLLQEYKDTGNPRALEKVKKYCQNDVEITLGVVLYLLSYQKVQFDGKTHDVTIDMFCDLGGRKGSDTDGEGKKDDLFS